MGRIPRRHSYEHCLRISIYNTDRPILNEIRETWGGTLTSVASRNPSWKPSYALIWTNAAAARFLGEIAPYLRVKSRQAAVLEQFQRRLVKCRRRRDRRGRLLPLAKREKEVREAFYRRIKNLNMKGSASATGRLRLYPRVRSSGVPSVEYLAGFMDAEGCLRLTKTQFEGWNPRYAARIQLSNTNRRVLDDLRQKFGGILMNHPRRNLRWKDEYQLVWIGRTVEPILRAIAPYLRIKRKHARILLQFIDHRKKTRQGRIGRGFGRLPKHVIAYREARYVRMKELNTKGPPSLWARA